VSWQLKFPKFLLLSILVAGTVLALTERDALSQEGCNSAKVALNAICCSGDHGSRGASLNDVFRRFGLPPPPTDVVTVSLCDGSTKGITCIHKSVAGSIPPRQDKTDSILHNDQNAPCALAWANVETLCTPDKVPAKLDACSMGADVSALPFCEDLQQLSGHDWCSVWNLSNCRAFYEINPYSRNDPDIALAQAERECLREWTLDTGKEKQKDLNSGFVADPKLFPRNLPAAPPVPAGTVDPLQPLPVSLAVAELPLSGIRLEMPGNFIRYFVQNLALPAGIKNVADTFQKKGIDGSCDVNTLTCSLNAAHLIDVPGIIDSHRKVGFGSGFNIPQGLVNAHSERTDDGWDISKIDINVGPFQLHWWGTVSLINKKPLTFTLQGPDTHLRLLPLHDPKHENPPNNAADLAGVDQKARYLDRVWFIHPIPTDICNSIKYLKYEDGEIKSNDSPDALSGKYITAVQPFQCNCPPPGSPPSLFGSNGSNYCITDPYSREVLIPALKSGLPGEAALRNRLNQISSAVGPVSEIFCDPRTQRVLTDPKADLGFLNSPIDKIDIRLALAGWNQPQRNQLWNNIKTFGCMGGVAERLDSGPSTTTVVNGKPVKNGKELSSGIGFDFDTKVDLGETQVAISPAPITIDFPLEFHVSKWIEDNVPILGVLGVVIGWIIELILTIIAAVFTVIASLYMAVYGPLITGTLLFLAVDLKPGAENLSVQGIISHVNGPVMDTGTGLFIRNDTYQAGVRRIVTTRPNVQTDTWAYHFNAPSCKRLAEGEGRDGFEEVVNFLKNAVLCPLEVIGNLYQALTLPVRNLLLWLINELVFDVQDAAEQAITANVIDNLGSAESDSNLGTLMQNSLQAVTGVPDYLITDATVKAAVPPGIPPWFNWICQITHMPIASCNIAQLFGFNGEAPSFERFGAMTHYRSLQDYGISTPNEIMKDMIHGFSSRESFYPPVRYCYGGDVPRSGLTDYRDDDGAGLLEKLSSIEEMHYSTSPGPTTDWRNQCAGFVDSRVRLHLFLPVPNPPPELDTFETIIVPSVRTNYLMNELFFCPTAQSCNFGFSIKSLRDCLTGGGCNLSSQMNALAATPPFSKSLPPMALRAELAVCSMTADIWYRLIPHSESAGTSNKPLTNLLSQAPEALDVLTSIIDRTCPISASCAANHNSAVDFYNTWVEPCSELLQFYGLYDPVHKLQWASVPASLK
jgi:hypothetical protein